MAMTKSPRTRSGPGGPSKPEKGFVDKAWDVQTRIENRASRVGKGKYGRVLRMARKPTKEEFNRVSKITALGILVIGLIGFVIFYFMRFIPGVSP